MSAWTMMFATANVALMFGAVVNVSAPVKSSHTFSFFDQSQHLPSDRSVPGTSTSDIDLADLDGDGDLDVFLSESGADQDGRPNRLLLNDGHGHLRDGSRGLPKGREDTRKAAVGDVDADGDLDLLLANRGPDQLLLNDGSGVFTVAPQTRLPSLSEHDESSDVVFADVDRDGDLDALISDGPPLYASGRDRIARDRLYLNDGHGTFRTAPLPAATNQTTAILTGDLDRDGKLDLVMLGLGQERVLIGDGRGQFRDETQMRMPALVSDDPYASSSCGGGLADFDRDGDLDLVVGNTNGQPVEYFVNNGSGHFTRAAFGHSPTPGERISSVTLADLNRDGALDIYLTNRGADRYFVNLRGAFEERTREHFTPPDDATSAAAFGDLDGDGDLDLFIGNSDDGLSAKSGNERLYMQRWRRGLMR